MTAIRLYCLSCSLASIYAVVVLTCRIRHSPVSLFILILVAVEIASPLAIKFGSITQPTAGSIVHKRIQFFKEFAHLVKNTIPLRCRCLLCRCRRSNCWSGWTRCGSKGIGGRNGSGHQQHKKDNRGTSGRLHFDQSLETLYTTLFPKWWLLAQIRSHPDDANKVLVACCRNWKNPSVCQKENPS